MTVDQIILAAEIDGTSINRNQAEELSRLNACQLTEVDGKLMLCLSRKGVEILARDSPDQARAKAVMDFVDNIGEWNGPEKS